MAENTTPETWTDRNAAAAQHREARNAAQEASNIVSILATSMQRKTILDGEISGTITDSTQAYWIIYVGGQIIKIPFSDSYMTLPQDLLNGSGSQIRRQNVMLAGSIGLTVPFIVTSMETDNAGNTVWVASRTMALERIRRGHFGRNAPRPVTVGSIVTGRIISFDAFTAYICVCGVDVRVPNYQLSHRYLGDVSEEFNIGEEIDVQVMSLDTKGSIPKMVCSRKPLEVQEWTPRLKMIDPEQNMRFRGIVTSIRKDQRGNTPGTVYNLWLRGINVGAFSSTTRVGLDERITTGTEVEFQVRGISRTGYVYGDILFVIKPPQF